MVNRKFNGALTTFDAATWKALDDRVQQCRAEGDARRLAQSLSDAHRFTEAFEVTKQLSSQADAPASDWILHASTALGAGMPGDALAAYKKALTLDPNASVPNYRELAVAAPPSLALVGVDLPPDREGSVRSIHSDTPAELVVHNKTAYTLDVVWLNFNAQREGSNRIPPGGTCTSHTFLTHPFLVCDSNGRALGILETRERSRSVVLAESPDQRPSPPEIKK
jgi:hypothetical protein